MALTRWNKLWIIVTLCSLLGYVLWWFYSSIRVVQETLIVPSPVGAWWIWVDPILSGLVGNILRLIAVSLALLSAYVVWKPKSELHSSVKKYIALALLCEALYYFCALPINILILGAGIAPILMLAFTSKILLVSPTLAITSRKIWSHKQSDGKKLLRLISIASTIYLASIWINNILRWVSMTEGAGTGTILSGINLLGFLNPIITLSLSLLFAIAGFYIRLKNGKIKLSTKFFALSLIMIGLHFTLYLLYATTMNMLNSVLLVEIWPIPLMFLGLSLIRGET